MRGKPFSRFLTVVVIANIVISLFAVPRAGAAASTGGFVLTKWANTDYYYHVGDEITYHYTIQNTGTTPIDGPFWILDNKIAHSDPRGNPCTGAPSPLPGPSAIITCPDQVYTITAADIASPEVTNHAQASNDAQSVFSNEAVFTVSFVGQPEGGVCFVNVAATAPGDGNAWETAYTSLYSALLDSACAEIWVAQGVYTPFDGSVYYPFEIPAGRALYGGFDGTETLRTERDAAAHVTILSGDVDGNDVNTDGNFIAETWNDIVGQNIGVMVMDGTVTPVTGTTVLDGFTITAGIHNWWGDGGGLFCDGHGAGSQCSPTLSNLVFSGNTAGTYGAGGAVYTAGAGGGDSSPTLTNVTFAGNQASAGGGMFNSGDSSPTLTNVIFTGNVASEVGGGMATDGASGGGTSPTLTNVTFTGNVANYGGAIFNSGEAGVSSPTLTNVVFSFNQATSGGGAFLNDGFQAGNSSPQITNALFLSNSAPVGGAFYNAGDSGNSRPSFTNVTFADNSATTKGGAVYNESNAPGTMNPTFQNVTFSGNTSVGDGPAIYNEGTNLASVFPDLLNVILWGNTRTGSGTAGCGLICNANGATTSVSHSVVQGGCGSIPGAVCGAGNLSSDPLLAALADNGGFTQTMALRAGSSAIDAGDNGSCPSTDQRGSPRPLDGNGDGSLVCDIGAYESAAPTVCFVNAAATPPGDGNAWETAYTDLHSALFDDACAETWVAQGVYKSGWYEIPAGRGVYGGFDGTESLRTQHDPAAHVTILSGDVGGDDVNTDGNFIAETWNDIVGTNYQVVIMDGGTTPVTSTTVLDGFTITAGGNSDGAGLLCYAIGDSAQCSPTLSNLVFSGNRSGSEAGGAEFYGSDGGESSPTLTNVTFTGNFADLCGGGMFISAEVNNSTLTNVTFSDNYADQCGGGMFTDGNPTLTSVTFSGNTASGLGGGMFSLSCLPGGVASPMFTDVVFTLNEADRGGALFNGVCDGGNGSPQISNALFLANSAQWGGAVYNASLQAGDSAVANPSFTNVTFVDNTAALQGGAVFNESDGTGAVHPTFENVTFSGSTSVGDGPVMYNGGSDPANIHPELVNVILWDNTRTGSGTLGCGVLCNANGSTTSINHSVVQGGCAAIPGAVCGAGNLSTDPLLAALADNGGFTQTMALRAGSSAIDAGDNGSCPSIDQRGEIRPVDGDGDGIAVCDAGAYEYQPLTPWVGSISVKSDQNIVVVGRPHIGSQVMAYDAFTGGSQTMYVPMLFSSAWGSYDAALYVQNVDSSGPTDITIKYHDWDGNLTCSHDDTIPALSSHGYWMPSECVPAGWVGSATITSTRNIVAIGRPHVGTEITSYNGFASGALNMYVPMLFHTAWGSYESALYVQNVDDANTADITIKYYDWDGNLTCQRTDNLPKLSSHGYWIADECVPHGWVGDAVITADHNIVAMARPHVGSQVTAYDGFAGGTLSAYVPMMYGNASGGTQNTALYVQNVDPDHTANIQLDFYDRDGHLTCTDQGTAATTIAPSSVRGYWLATDNCVGNNWTGAVKITSNYDVVAMARPQFSAEVFAYNGFTAGAPAAYVPMLFAMMWGTYNSGFYLMNLDDINAANVTIQYYDVDGNLTYEAAETLDPMAAKDVWVPDVLIP